MSIGNVKEIPVPYQATILQEAHIIFIYFWGRYLY